MSTIQMSDEYSDNNDNSIVSSKQIFQMADSASTSASNASTVELLYIWINRDRTGFIREQGFNFSPNFRFDLKLIDDGHHYELTCTTNLDYPNIWNTDNIVNLTAVVGENGSGKTSLLGKVLFSSLIKTLPEGTARDKARTIERNAINKTIQIFRINGTVHIYHNFPVGILQNTTKFCCININEQDYVQFTKTVDTQTRIYITNGVTYPSFVSESRSYVDSIVFSPTGNKALSKEFFEKGIVYKLLQYPARFSFLQQRINSCKTYEEFEKLVTVNYYYHLYSENISYNSFLNGNNRVKVSILNPVMLFEKHYGLIDADSVQSDFDSAFDKELFYQLVELVKWLYSSNHIKHMGPVAEAYLALIFELLFITADQTFQCNYDDEKTLFVIAKQLIESYEQKNDHQKDVLCYYQAALCEIEEFSKLLEECGSTQNGEEQSKKKTIEIDRKKKPEEFRRFCQYINRLMRKEMSFVLKYIDIKIPSLASGEQALQNILAWLRVPLSYKEIIGRKSIGINDNILLLLDEVDLYMHPEWQRKLLKLLSDELKAEYPEKHIQVVISTHSPLVLSDIPTRNIIYLEKNDYQCTIAQGPEQRESFGANIFSLLKDSFFLQRSMGEFAYSKITDVISDLNALKKEPDNALLREKCRGYKSLIKIIGEPVVQRKLYARYTELFGADSDEQCERYIDHFSRKLNSDDPVERIKYRTLLQKILSDAQED